MCGIAGAWNTPPLEAGSLRNSLEAIAHRGPDDWGEYYDPPVAFGMRRLSIIDLSGGHQPLSNEDGSVWVVFNGEIYNYKELASELISRGHRFQTATDTEVLVHLYEEKGPELCNSLRGMFAFAIWDRRKHQLLLARDRFGKKPLYYTSTPQGGLLFASELKALRPLMVATGISPQLRHQSIYDYLSLGYVPQPETIYRDVLSVPAGGYLTFEGQTPKPSIYWCPEYRTTTQCSYADALSRTRDLIAEAVRLRLRSDVPLGVFLSSGVDSSVVTWEAAQQLGSSLHTFTVGTDNPDYDESGIAARTAASLGVKHTILPMKVAPLEEIQLLSRRYDQPFADSSAIPSLAISRMARQHVKVVLNGDGGDEIFSGYRRYIAAYIQNSTHWIPQKVTALAVGAIRRVASRRRSKLGFLQRFMRAKGMSVGERYLAWTADMLFEDDKRRFWLGDRMRPTEQLIESAIDPKLSDLSAAMSGDHHFNFVSNMLVKMDIATMAASIEGRSPLMDHKVAEFVFSLPEKYRLRRFRRKSLLRDAYRGRLSAEVLEGRKRGFEVPMRHWLANELRDFTIDHLSSPAAQIRSFLDGRFIADLLEKKILLERNWEYLVYSLLILELWLQEDKAETSQKSLR